VWRSVPLLLLGCALALCNKRQHFTFNRQGLDTLFFRYTCDSMRILPEPYEGLHVALPPPDARSKSPAPGATFQLAVGGLFGVLPLAVGYFFKFPAARALGLEFSTYGMLGGACWAWSNEHAARNMKSDFLHAQKIKVPERKVVDRLGRFDRDDTYLIGAASGLAVASVARRPWCLVGWKPWVGSASMGGTLAMLSTTLAELTYEHLVSNSSKNDLLEVQKRRIELAGWQLTIMKTALLLQELRQGAAGVVAPPIPAKLQLPEEIINIQGTSPGQDWTRHKYGHGAVSWPNESDKPHLTQSLKGDEEPSPYAHTNYLQQGTVSHLESYIEALQQRRFKLAEELDPVGHLTARKELEYYPPPVDRDHESDEKLAARRYVEMSGGLHGALWMEISSYDWCIADARKRMEQMQSAQGFAQIKAGRPPPTAIAEGRRTAERSLQRLQRASDEIEERLQSLKKAEKQLRQIRSDMLHQRLVDTGTDEGRQRKIAQVLKDCQGQLAAAEMDAATVRRVTSDLKHALALQ
jgi:hypothetical protein